MTNATFICADGARRDVDVAIGTNLMRAACDHGIEDIVGDCGGALSCATCHVFVDPDDIPALPPMEEMEDEMLYGAAVDRTETSRLSCQIRITDDLDLHVTTPETQV